MKEPTIVTLDLSKPITLKDFHDTIHMLHERDVERRTIRCGPCMEIDIEYLMSLEKSDFKWSNEEKK